MSGHHFLRWAIASLVALLALVGIVPASAAAAQPVRTTMTRTITGVTACGTFALVENATGVEQITTFFDNAGTPVRVQVHFTYSGTLTNTATGTVVPVARSPQNVVIDPRGGTVTLHGVAFRLTLPGQEVVVRAIGTTVFNPDGSIVVTGRANNFAGDQSVL